MSLKKNREAYFSQLEEYICSNKPENDEERFRIENDFNKKNPELYKSWIEAESLRNWIESGCVITEQGQFDTVGRGGIANLVERKFGDKEAEPIYSCAIYMCSISGS